MGFFDKALSANDEYETHYAIPRTFSSGGNEKRPFQKSGPGKQKKCLLT